MSLLPVGFGASGDFTIEESLRFNASQSSYLSWTPSSAGNRKTWTWSGWVKRGALGAAYELFGCGANSTNDTRCFFGSGGTGDQLEMYVRDSSTIRGRLITTQVFRDVSAWYHIVVVWDSSNATSSNRFRFYINGSRVTSFTTEVQPPLNTDSLWNSTQLSYIGRTRDDTNTPFDGYLTEVNFIDGQALDASSFGETDAVTGVWKPKKYVGTYGTNGFYLPMKLDNTTEGFNTVTWRGTGSTQQITGVGFSPDLVWIKERNSATDHVLENTISGAGVYLSSNTTAAEASYATGLLSFNTDGFSVGSGGAVNGSGDSYVAWCWDAGNSTVSNSDGSITSSVRANPTYGFSVVTYTGTGSAGTVGHGLGATPAMIITKNRSSGSTDWTVWHQSNSGFASSTGYIYLNKTDAAGTTQVFYNGTAMTSTSYGIDVNSGGSAYINQSGQTYVAYCFSEVSGYSKFGSYTGTGASGNTVTLGFRPAFLLIKETGNANSWELFDNTRSPVNPVDKRLFPNSSQAEVTTTSLNFTDTGFETLNGNTGINRSGGTYIYMAFADTREYAFWLDDSGNNNDWQPNGGITTQSSVTDVPTLTSETSANYCTWNPLNGFQNNSVGTLSNGNLTRTDATTTNAAVVGTFQVATGKWYWEINVDALGVTNNYAAVISSNNYSNAAGVRADGTILNASATGSGSYTTGDLLGVAVDIDANTMYVYKNGSLTWTLTPTTAISNFSPAIFDGTTISTAFTITANFGQRPFAYTPPTGFKALNTYNLPDSTVADGSDYFNTVLYTGTGSTQSITGVRFSPDLVWIKDRTSGGSTSWSHNLYDTVRGISSGGSPTLFTDNTDYERTYVGYGVSEVNSDGFKLIGNGSLSNLTGESYVAWNWKANGSGVSNTDGSITSTVSANTTAGFSIVTYTGTGSAATVGHGLGSAPKMVIAKKRDGTTYDWVVYHASLGASAFLFLNLTNAAITGSSLVWNSTTPTSSVFSIGTSPGSNNSGSAYVAYCFADVEGYSKTGSYIGNGSADGPFVYTGFRPAWVMVKRTDTANNWNIIDFVRSPYNTVDDYLFPNLSNAEATNVAGYEVDFVSNGFKLKGTGTSINASGGTYIYMAFAENPLKNSLAR